MVLAIYLGWWPAVPARLMLQGHVWTHLHHPKHPDVSHTHAPRYRCCILAAAEINIISISWWGWNNISGGFGREMEETQFVKVCPWATFLFPENRRIKPSLLMKGISTLTWTLVRKTERIVCDGSLHQNGSGDKLKLRRKFSLFEDKRSVCFLPLPLPVPMHALLCLLQPHHLQGKERLQV